MKRAVCFILLLALGALTYLLFPQDAASKARFYPLPPQVVFNPPAPEPKPAPEPILEPEQEPEPDSPQDIYITGGDGMATTGFLKRSSGQTITIDLTGKSVISARVRFRGVNGSATTYEYKDSAKVEKSGSSPAGVSALSSSVVPSPPSGYEFNRANIFASVSASRLMDWWISAAHPGGAGIGSKSGTGSYGSLSVEAASPPGTTVEFTLGHMDGCTWITQLWTTGRKAVTTTTYSTNPSCAGGSHSGTLTGGTVSGWYTASLQSNKVNTLTVSVGGSNIVEVEIEYTTKQSQSAPSAPSVSNLTPTSATLTSDAGSLIVCNGETKASGSTWALKENTSYSAYAYLPETDTHDRSPNSPATSFSTKQSQPAPSAPSVSNLTPTSATLTSDAGSLIVCNGETKASGSTWSGLSEQTNYSAYAYLPETDTHQRSPNSSATSFTTASPTGPPSVQTLSPTDLTYASAVIRGNVSSANGATPTKYLRWGYSSDEMSNVIEAGTGTGQFSAEIQLDPGEKYFYQAYATNSYGTSQGAVLSFETPYPRLPAPTQESPEQGSRLQDRRPWLIFTLPTMEANPATAYHAKARVSEYAVMSPLMYTFDSAAGTGDWQFWDGAAWLPFPAEGVAPGTKVRCRAPVMMAYRAFYWDCTAFDGTVWGTNSSAWDFRILIAVSRTFSLVINDQEIVGVKDIIVSETCNGELGEIAFSLDNKEGQANEINYNDLVILGINDKLNNTDEFRGLVRDKTPVQGKLMRFNCITGDGILAERIVKKDYAAQDIGLSLKDAIDTYGAPLASTGINTATGIVAEIKSKDKSLLQMCEQVRRDFNLLYRVDNEFVVHLYGESAIQPAIVQIQYGDGGVTC